MARSTITVKQILADARMLVRGQGVNFSEPTDNSMIQKYNIALGSVFKALNGAKLSRFYTTSPLGSPADYIKMLDTDNHTYTSSTKTISEAAGTALTIDSTFAGALVFYGTVGGAVYSGYITSVTTDTSFKLDRDDRGSDITAGALWYIVLKKPSALTSLTIANHRVDEIRRITMPLVGNVARLNPDSYAGVSNNPNYDNSVVSEFGGSSGPIVKMTAGSGVTNSGGFPIMYYDEKPKVADDTAEYVDLPEDYHGPLIEEIARMIVVEVGSKVPKSLENPLMTLMKFTDVFQATKDALVKSEDTP